ncbi:putative RNA methyltransferase [Lolliginicoccus suaedae]|uniref:putative RNA methyltransferase n=1 Tax=Lolliginicoccus suaedae TaxID=2605429 RepID=UPI0011EC2EF7|nr:methyltransferase domain-containing protein [Lolliginicoccus suaedae]
MIDRIVEWLRCPQCAMPLQRAEQSLRCDRGHSFDIARQGYVSLLRGGRNPIQGDDAGMIAAREELFARGHYRVIEQAIAGIAARACQSRRDPLIVDIGAGIGNYLAAALEHLPAGLGIGIDVSKPAARRLGRAHPRAGAIIADVWSGLPLADQCADVALTVFAPRNAAEIARILRPGGTWLIATPAAHHLAELARIEGVLSVDERKGERLAATVGESFVQRENHHVRATIEVTKDEAERVLAMGPTAWHLDRDQRARAVESAFAAVEATTRMPLTLSVDITEYQLASSPGSEPRSQARPFG